MSSDIRKCKKCNHEKPLKMFPKAAVIKGKEYRRYVCNKCYVAGKRARKLTLQAWYYKLKSNHACDICGENDFRVLEFHHRDPNVKFRNIADMVIVNFKRCAIIDEMKKCDCLCANCHRKKTFDEFFCPGLSFREEQV